MIQFPHLRNRARRCNIAVICSVVVFCVVLIGCSSDDNGKLAELERQLDMEEAARMKAEQERDAAQVAQAAAEAAQTMAGQERDDAKAAQVMAEQAQALQ